MPDQLPGTETRLGDSPYFLCRGLYDVTLPKFFGDGSACPIHKLWICLHTWLKQGNPQRTVYREMAGTSTNGGTNPDCYLSIGAWSFRPARPLIFL